MLLRLDDVARSSYARITAVCQPLKARHRRVQARRYFLDGRHYADDKAKMNSFFRELKNRRVYRVALGYAVAAWFVIQIAFTVLPTFHVPEGLLQGLVVLAALGFPAALMLAWAFDVDTRVAARRCRFRCGCACSWELLALASVAQRFDDC